MHAFLLWSCCSDWGMQGSRMIFIRWQEMWEDSVLTLRLIVLVIWSLSLPRKSNKWEIWPFLSWMTHLKFVIHIWSCCSDYICLVIYSKDIIVSLQIWTVVNHFKSIIMPKDCRIFHPKWDQMLNYISCLYIFLAKCGRQFSNICAIFR